MFKKEKKTVAMPEPFTPEQPSPVVKAGSTEEHSQGNTVVAVGVVFEGNICSTGTIYIHGKVHGNIESVSGMIKIMRTGMVEGNIIGKKVIIDGVVQGQCHAEAIDIHENGKMTGAITYQTLAVKHGAMFSGNAETRPAATSNVVDIISNEADDVDTEALQEILNYNG